MKKSKMYQVGTWNDGEPFARSIGSFFLFLASDSKKEQVDNLLYIARGYKEEEVRDRGFSITLGEVRRMLRFSVDTTNYGIFEIENENDTMRTHYFPNSSSIKSNHA